MDNASQALLAVLATFVGFLDATDVGFAFPGRFNVRMNNSLFTDRPCPTCTFILNIRIIPVISFVDIRTCVVCYLNSFNTRNFVQE